jgi:hypothetical protein
MIKKREAIGITMETLLGLLFVFIGIVNTFWGNDFYFGLFIIALSLNFFLPFRNLLKRKTGVWIAVWLRLLIGMFIIWSSVGVGELFEKLEMMVESLK